MKEMLQRTTVGTLASVALPEFSASPGEDVNSFVHKFELATLLFSNELRCLALYKALSGPAYTWAKNSVADLITTGQWDKVKRALISRYLPPNNELRLREALSKMKFNPDKETISTFVEQYSDKYRQVHQNAADKDIIRSISLNLPDNILRCLHLLSANWLELDKIELFNDLIRRIEHNILPLENQEADRNPAIKATDLVKLFIDLKSSIKTQIDDALAVKENSKEEKTAAAAVIVGPNATTRPHPQQFRKNFGNYRANNEPIYSRNYAAVRNSNGYQIPNHNQALQTPSNVSMLPRSQNNDSPHKRFRTNPVNPNSPLSRYFQKFGHVPSPCMHCGGMHLHKHCPLMNENLN